MDNHNGNAAKDESPSTSSNSVPEDNSKENNGATEQEKQSDKCPYDFDEEDPDDVPLEAYKPLNFRPNIVAPVEEPVIDEEVVEQADDMSAEEINFLEDDIQLCELIDENVVLLSIFGA